MQSSEYPSQDSSEITAEDTSIDASHDASDASFITEDEEVLEDPSAPLEPFKFFTRFVDAMEMYTDAATVATYFDVHEGWFQDCASPMKAEAIGTTGYALTIGRFGAFGYQVEPKIGLDLIPSDNGVYRIQTIPVPGYVSPGYDVDFQASMTLVEDASQAITVKDKRTGTITTLPVLTRVEWDLRLTVWIQFPRFIYRLPQATLQKTGNGLLYRIVREVSNRLTMKVQDDFHSKRGLPSPSTTKRIQA